MIDKKILIIKFASKGAVLRNRRGRREWVKS
jgi:hypothetical protein